MYNQEILFKHHVGISVFREGVSRTLFSSVFLRYFFRIGSKVCDVYIQHIRLAKADVLKIHIAYAYIVKTFSSSLCFAVKVSNRDVEQLHNHIIHYLYSISCGRTKWLHKMLRDANYSVIVPCI